MLKFLNLQPEIFGLDINDLSLKIAKIKRRGKYLRLASYIEAKIPHGIIKEGVIQDKEALAKIVRTACASVKGEKLNTKYVALSLPEEKSFLQVIQMPMMTELELKSAVPFEAENYIPLSMDKVYMDYQVLEKSSSDIGNHLDLLVNVMPRPIIDSYVYVAKQAGLIPCVMEVESQAIVRALTKTSKTPMSQIFIDLGKNNTSFIIYSGDSIKFTSSLSVYAEQFTTCIAQKLNLSDAEAERLKIRYGITSLDRKYNIKDCMIPVMNELVKQIKKYIAFYKGHAFHADSVSDHRIEKIILSGGGANLKGLMEFLSREIGLPVEIGNPMVNLRLNGLRISAEKSLSFTTAIGLALRGVNENISYD